MKAADLYLLAAAIFVAQVVPKYAAALIGGVLLLLAILANWLDIRQSRKQSKAVLSQAVSEPKEKENS